MPQVVPLDFVHYPISHSLLAVVGWALLFAMAYHLLQKYPRGALVCALAVSHLTGSYFRSFTGILSPLCNALHAATAGTAAGAAAGCVALLGGGLDRKRDAVKRVLATNAGILCDGAKPSCSLRVGQGAARAVHAAQLVMAGTTATLGGIVDETVEETAANLGRLAHPALRPADRELLRVIVGE